MSILVSALRRSALVQHAQESQRFSSSLAQVRSDPEPRSGPRSMQARVDLLSDGTRMYDEHSQVSSAPGSSARGSRSRRSRVQGVDDVYKRVRTWDDAINTNCEFLRGNLPSSFYQCDSFRDRHFALGMYKLESDLIRLHTQYKIFTYNGQDNQYEYVAPCAQGSTLACSERGSIEDTSSTSWQRGYLDFACPSELANTLVPNLLKCDKLYTFARRGSRWSSDGKRLHRRSTVPRMLETDSEHGKRGSAPVHEERVSGEDDIWKYYGLSLCASNIPDVVELTHVGRSASSVPDIVKLTHGVYSVFSIELYRELEPEVEAFTTSFPSMRTLFQLCTHVFITLREVSTPSNPQPEVTTCLLDILDHMPVVYEDA